MALNLSNDDLKAIKGVVEEAIDDSDQRTAAAFAEVHDKFAEVHDKIDQVRIELKSDIKSIDDKLAVKDNKLENTVQRVDKHDEEITKINKKLSFAK